MFWMLIYRWLSIQWGQTAVMKAAAGGHLAVVTKLAELGVDVTAADNVRAIYNIYYISIIIIIIILCIGLVWFRCFLWYG